MWYYKQQEKTLPSVVPERYVLYPGAFREEFEQKGKSSYHFYLQPAEKHFCNLDESFVRQTDILAAVLCQGFEVYSLEDTGCDNLKYYGLQTRDYFALHPGSWRIEENDTKNKWKWFLENAELSIISDDSHAVWTILLGEGCSYQLLMERLEVFCENMGAFLRIEQ